MIPLIYVLQNGVFSDAEQMALAMLNGLRDEFTPYIFAPEGTVETEAQNFGLSTQTFSSATDLTLKLWRLVAENSELGFIATETAHSYSMILLNTFYRRKLTHLQVVTGRADENSICAKKVKLKKFEVNFIAHSESVRKKLIANGLGQENIRFIEKFLSEEKKAALSPRESFKSKGVKKILVTSSFETEGEIDLLFEALEIKPSLSELEFKIFGNGAKFEKAKKQVSERFPNVVFADFDEKISEKLAESDLFLQLDGFDSSGSAILEALAANVPVLVADDGGTGAVISHNINGFNFRANDAKHLAQRLAELSKASSSLLNSITKGGKYLLDIRFSAEVGIEKFRRLFNEERIPAVDLTGGKLIM